MNTTKTTYIDALTFAIDNLTNASQEVMDKLIALRAQHENRKNYVSKADKETAQKNAELAQILKMILATGGKMTVSEILAADPNLVENKISNQRIAYVLRTLKDAGEVVKLEAKGKSYYKLAE